MIQNSKIETYIYLFIFCMVRIKITDTLNIFNLSDLCTQPNSGKAYKYYIKDRKSELDPIGQRPICHIHQRV